tara:strand:+ start:483 stop:1040 length:558 start_codon:yes stop_codon:yes gene_type:complete
MNINLQMKKGGLRMMETSKPTLGFYKIHDESRIEFATEGSACFDLSAIWGPNDSVKVWSPVDSSDRRVSGDEVVLNQNERALIPTGLILDIPEGYSVRLYSRSGNAAKKGMMLVNGIGIIDSDYIQELFVPVFNTNKHSITIRKRDRVCQGELVQNEWYDIKRVGEAPTRDTEHGAGFGSTGGMS